VAKASACRRGPRSPSRGTTPISRSKTDKEGRGSVRFAAGDTYARGRAKWRRPALSLTTRCFVPLGPAAKDGRLTPRDVARIFKRRVEQPFSARSTRVGAAIEQRTAGLETDLIAQAGMWKGDVMPARYTRHISALESGAAISRGARGGPKGGLDALTRSCDRSSGLAGCRAT
jgi:hypothetical protein